jgi:hypothetical protein
MDTKATKTPEANLVEMYATLAHMDAMGHDTTWQVRLIERAEAKLAK